MKIKSIFLLIILFVLGQNIFAQEKKIDIECNLVINETNWTKDSQIKATITVKNNSDQKVKIQLPPSFRLLREGKKAVELRTFEDEYRSSGRERISNNNDNFTYESRQFHDFSLESGEAKTIEFNISKVVWKSVMSSIDIYQHWFDSIPSGNFDFYYDWSYSLGKKKKLQQISIISNVVSVKLNSEK